MALGQLLQKRKDERVTQQEMLEKGNNTSNQFVSIGAD